MDHSIAANLAVIQQRIAAAGGADVEILAVSKTFSLAAIEAAAAAGLHRFGESYAQEVVDKFPEGPPAPMTVSFIGHLQTNKVRLLRGRVDRVCSVDRPKLVAELAKRLPGVAVLIEVNTTAEDAKSGCRADQVGALIDECAAAGLTVEGLMTMGPTHGTAADTSRAFAALRALVDRHRLAVCSMGMSGDLELAVAEGSTEVRIGTALFGHRTPPPPHAGLT